MKRKLPTEGTSRWVRLLLDDELVLRFGPVTTATVQKYAREELLVEKLDPALYPVVHALRSVAYRYFAYIWFGHDLSEELKDTKVRMGNAIGRMDNPNEEHAKELMRRVLAFALRCEAEKKRVNSRGYFQWV